MESFGNKPKDKPTEAELDAKAKALVKKAEDVVERIDATDEKAKKAVDDFGLEVDAAENELDTVISELEVADEVAGNEIDKLMIKRAEEIANEEKDKESE